MMLKCGALCAKLEKPEERMGVHESQPKEEKEKKEVSEVSAAMLDQLGKIHAFQLDVPYGSCV